MIDRVIRLGLAMPRHAQPVRVARGRLPRSTGFMGPRASPGIEAAHGVWEYLAKYHASLPGRFTGRAHGAQPRNVVPIQRAKTTAGTDTIGTKNERIGWCRHHATVSPTRTSQAAKKR
jgi:hypothetical protein